jgi:hypothetical protein
VEECIGGGRFTSNVTWKMHSVYMSRLNYAYFCQTQLTTSCVHHRFDDEVKDDAHGVFTPEMMKFSQTTSIETFVDDVTDKSTGLPIFKELVWFVYKASGVMFSVSVCEHCWSIEGWTHSKT